MAHTLTNVPRSTSNVPAVAVPDEVAAELVALYQHLTKKPDESALAVFDTQKELDEFEAQARAWAAGQTPKLLVRRVRTKNPVPLQFKFVFKNADEDTADTSDGTGGGTE